jgi:hydroxypyruvate reductase
MMAMPADGVTLDDKIETGRLLLASGVAIEGINCVRKHLSAVKGGWLAARSSVVCTLAISDVTGRCEADPAVIGSGPGVPDRTTFHDAIAVLQQHGIWEQVPGRVRDRLDRGRRELVEETPKPGDVRLARSVAHVIGGRHDAMAAARQRAEALGYAATVVDDAVQGEAAAAGAPLVRRAAAFTRHERRACVISSGETTVHVRGTGRGGRNQELALAAMDALARLARPAALASVGTDGVDGPTDAAGALVDSSSAARAASAGIDVAAALAENDSFTALDRIGDLLRLGPTGTNVGDLQVLLVG